MSYALDPDGALDQEVAEPSPLRDVIVAQGMMETGIFVLLFTSDTVDGAAEAGAGEVDSARALVEQTAVEQTAAELGIDAAELTLFSDDAYLMQAALGEKVLPPS